MTESLTMSVSGVVIDTYSDGLATFKVKTRYGFALVWVYEEIEVDFRVGARFHVDDAPLVFSDGYPIATLKPSVMFYLNDTIYETSLVIGA